MRFWLLVGLFFLNNPAVAGLFADEEARKQIRQLEERIVRLEQALALTRQEREQSVRAMLDLQRQLDELNNQLRALRGQNEELGHGLQESEKRQKDFYVDLDTRLRRFEENRAVASEAAGRQEEGGGEAAVDPANEKRAFESAYDRYKAEDYRQAAEAFRAFLKHYPDSVHEANVLYWLGNATFLLKDCKSSLASYQSLVSKYPDHPRVPEAMLNIAECQLMTKNKSAARKTLKQIITQFPGSEASDKARKRLAAIKK